jgi:hypothetical protein
MQANVVLQPRLLEAHTLAKPHYTRTLIFQSFEMHHVRNECVYRTAFS